MTARAARTRTLATIGYEGTTVRSFLDALREAGITLLVDVRAVAMSRRPGFAKTKLAANLDEAGIRYLHLRGLGTPADGRAAARGGDHATMHAIFRAHLATDPAQLDLETLQGLVADERARVCILCFEADPRHCHRSLVAAALQERMPLEVVHLHAADDD